MALLRFKLRGGTAAEWTAANPVLAMREPGVETDTGRMKLGDGVRAWADLDYASKGDPGPQGPPGLPGPNAVPADTAVASYITTGGTQTADALAGEFVPLGRAVNGHPLSADVTLTAADVAAVPTARAVNGHALSADVTLTSGDVGAVPTARTVNGKALSANVSLAAADVGAVPTSSLGAANGVATLAADGTLVTSQLPALALVNVTPVASQAAMLALSNVQPGDLATRTDGAGTFMLTAAPASTLANWTLLNAPTDKVVSVNGQTGTVNLAPSDVGALPAGGTAAAATKLATARTIAGKSFDGTANVTIAAADVGAVPTTTTVNGHPLSANVSVSAADVGAPPATRTVNGHALSADVTVTASDLGLGNVTNTRVLTVTAGTAVPANTPDGTLFVEYTP